MLIYKNPTINKEGSHYVNTVNKQNKPKRKGSNRTIEEWL